MWSQNQAKPTCNNEWVPGLGGGETDCIVAQKAFWGVGNALHLGCGDG